MIGRKVRENDKKIVAIWAQDENGLIGKGDKLPWSLPADLAHFKETTTGHTMVMGRITFDGMGKRAPNRHTIVLTKNQSYVAENDRVTVVHSVEEVLDWYAHQEQTLFVIGGSQIFMAFAAYIDQLIVTDIHGQFDGDTFSGKIFRWNNFACRRKHSD